MRHIKNHEFLDKLYDKSVLLAEEYEIKIDDTLYEFLRRFTESTMIDLLEDDDDTRFFNILTK